MNNDLTAQVAVDIGVMVSTVAPFLTGTEVTIDAVQRAAACVVPDVIEDLRALASRDTAARADPRYVYASYLSFHALLAYRVAHAIYRLGQLGGEEFQRDAGIACAARRISEEAKVRTGVEIHPGASIGRRMVIDHGWGTVIGEYAQVGDDCYFLQNITLGCRRIGSPYGAGERRHPTVGDRVVIAGDVCVFGPVTIGDDCRIDPGAHITCDVPAGTHVCVITRLQVTRPSVRQTTSDSLPP